MNLQQIGFDGRQDRTLFPKNQLKWEEHITFTDEQDYIAHAAVSSKHGPVVSKEIVKVVEDTESTSSLQILASDGENANTGHTGQSPSKVFEKKHPFNQRSTKADFSRHSRSRFWGHSQSCRREKLWPP